MSKEVPGGDFGEGEVRLTLRHVLGPVPKQAAGGSTPYLLPTLLPRLRGSRNPPWGGRPGAAHLHLVPACQWGLLGDWGGGGRGTHTESTVGGRGYSVNMSLGNDHDLVRVHTVRVPREPQVRSSAGLRSVVCKPEGLWPPPL